jgi:hypothetical protein
VYLYLGGGRLTSTFFACGKQNIVESPQAVCICVFVLVMEKVLNSLLC